MKGVRLDEVGAAGRSTEVNELRAGQPLAAPATNKVRVRLDKRVSRKGSAKRGQRASGGEANTWWAITSPLVVMVDGVE